MKNKIAAGILMLTMAVSALSGCAGKPAANNTNSDSASKELKVMVFAHQLTKDLENFEQFKQLEEESGVKINWEYVRSDFEEKISIMFAGEAKDLPDVIIGGLNSNQITQFKSSLTPMEEHISAENTPNIYNAMEQDEILKKISMNLEGHIYSLSNRKAFRPQSTSLWIINKTWLDNLGLEVPKTLEELKNVLIAFRDNDANGNGDPSDEIPMDWNNDANQNVSFSALNLTASFGRIPTWINVDAGTVDYLPITEEYKNTIAYLHELYAENLVNTEVFTQGYSQMQAKAQNEDAPLVGFTFGWDIADRVGKWADQYIAIAPPKANDGVVIRTPNDGIGLQYQQNVAVVPRTGNEELAIKWLDNFYTDEMAVQNYFGSFGVVTEKTDAGYKTLAIPEGENMDGWQWKNSLKDGAPMYYSAQLEGKTEVWEDALKRLTVEEVYAPFRADVKLDTFPLVTYNDEDNEILLLEQDMQSIIYPKWAEWIVYGGVEDEWDSYVDTIQGLGAEQLIDVWQRAYDNFYKE